MAYLRSRVDEHFGRKFFHLISASLIAFIFVNLESRFAASLLMLSSSLLLGVFDLLRLRFKKLNALILGFGGFLMREEERHAPSAQLYYLMGLCWAVVFLPRPIAVQAMLTLAWLDPIAGIFGTRFGKRSWGYFLKKVFVLSENTRLKLGNKTLEGSAVGFFAAFLAGIVAWSGAWSAVLVNGTLWWPSLNVILLFSGMGAVVATLAEIWPSQWDDNVNIPFWTGLILWEVALILNIPLNFA